MQQTRDQSFQNLIEQNQSPQQQESNASERRIQHIWQLQGAQLNINNMQDDEEAFQEDKLKEQEQPPEPNLKNEEKNPQKQCLNTTRCSEEQGQVNQEQKDFDQHDEILIGEPQVIDTPKKRIRYCRRRFQKLKAIWLRMRYRKGIQSEDLIVRTVKKPKGEGVKKVINYTSNKKIIKSFNQSVKLKKRNCKAQILIKNRVSSKKINIRRLKHSPNIQMIQKLVLQIAFFRRISNLQGYNKIYLQHKLFVRQHQLDNIIDNILLQEQIRENQIKINQYHEVNEEIQFFELVPNSRNDNKDSSKEMILIINHEESQIEEILYEDYQYIYQLLSDPQNPNQNSINLIKSKILMNMEHIKIYFQLQLAWNELLSTKTKQDINIISDQEYQKHSILLS